MAQSQMQISSTSRTAKGGKQLGDIPKFEEPDTNPNGAAKSIPPPSGSSNASDQEADKREEEQLSKPSIVFTAHRQVDASKGGEAAPHRIDNLGLEPGYHVAARLEAMATTAVHAPVAAVVEFNYERNGQILIPAGSRVVGKITQADPSGLINITFSSIEFPGGEDCPDRSGRGRYDASGDQGKGDGQTGWQEYAGPLPIGHRRNGGHDRRRTERQQRIQ